LIVYGTFIAIITWTFRKSLVDNISFNTDVFCTVVVVVQVDGFSLEAFTTHAAITCGAVIFTELAERAVFHTCVFTKWVLVYTVAGVRGALIVVAT
jgi:hypothetical protein